MNMVRYDESIIKRYAQALYDQADLSVFLFTLIGILLGGGAGWMMQGEVGAMLGAVLLGTIGYFMGQSRAFQLKLTAQLALCQVQIERNTRSSRQASGEAIEVAEEEYHSQNGVIVTNKRLILPSNEWFIDQFQPVKVEPFDGKYRINLLDKSGRRVHHLNSDSQERLQLIAAAINKALSTL
jgi:uncharacterized membrane protein YeaQ/YmgE (transglycosylase-associated protein family)